MNRRGEHEAAAKLFDLCERRKIKGYICSHEITILSYFMEKFKYPEEKRIFIITNLLDIFTIIPTTKKILRNALNSEIKDYEDEVIEVSARAEEVEFIVSRNLKDLKAGKTECLSALKALAILEE